MLFRSVTVVFVSVENDADERALRVSVFHELIDPRAVVKSPPLILYSPPTIDRAVGAFIQVIVRVLDMYWVPSSAPVRAVKL